jgi:hypothetical protein
MTTANIKYVVQGNSYDGVANAKLTWAVTKDFTIGWTATLTVRHRLSNVVLLTKAITVADATTIEALLTASDTAFAALSSPQDYGPHPYVIDMTSGVAVQSLMSDGVLDVAADV